MVNLQLLVLLNCLWLLSCQELVLVKSENEDDPSVSENVEVSNSEVFVPTNDWQEVKTGQAIPRGLHVRIDMQTGKKEAKLLNEDNIEEDPHAALKEAMKNIKEDFKVNNDGKIENKFRSMSELKSELGDIDLKVKTDFQVMTELVKTFKESDSPEEKASVLESLEYYVHHIDNAIDFLQLDGLKDIILPSLNSSSQILRKEACQLLGAAAQSNPKFQRAALSEGFTGHLLRLASLEPEPSIAVKALYSLSAMIRNFPEAQMAFLNQGGLGVLAKIFQNEGLGYDKLKIKMLTLIHDLLVERETSNPALRRLYDHMSLETQVYEAGWCQLLDKVLVIPKSDRSSRRVDILSTLSEDFPLRAEHDSIEKILGAMLKMLPICAGEFSMNIELRSKLSFLGSQYSELRDKEQAEGDDDNFFSGILDMIKTLRANIHKSEL